MDLSTITLDTTTILSMGLVVLTAYAAIWAIRKVIALSKA